MPKFALTGTLKHRIPVEGWVDSMGYVCACHCRRCATMC